MKFNYVVASLSPEFATEILDLIINLPMSHPYDTLREQHIKRTTASEQKRLQQLIHEEVLGNQTHSQLLRRMKQLLSEEATGGGSFLKELYLQQLLRMVLASVKESDFVEALAVLADKIAEVAPPPIAPLAAEVEQIRKGIAAVKTLFRSFSPPPSEPASRFRQSPSPAKFIHNAGDYVGTIHSLQKEQPRVSSHAPGI